MFQNRTETADDRENCTETNIAKLLQTYRHEVDLLKSRVKDVCEDDDSYDDLFLLRYVMSSKGLDMAEEKVRFKVKHREDHKQIYAAIARGDAPPANDIITGIKDGQLSIGYHRCLRNGTILHILRVSLIDPSLILDTLGSSEELANAMVWHKEVMWHKLDQKSRETGHLVKVVDIQDLSGVTFSYCRNKLSRAAMRAVGASQKMSEMLHPQMMARAVLLNPPSFFHTFFRIAKPFMGASAVSKMHLCRGNDLSSCQELKDFIDDLPSIVGGKCNCPGGCIKATMREIIDSHQAKTNEGERRQSLVRR